MEFLPLAFSWEVWLSAHSAELVAIVGFGTMISFAIVYRANIRRRIERTPLGIKLRLITKEEQERQAQELQRAENEAVLEHALDELLEALKLTKTESGRVLRLKDFDLEIETALPGREQAYRRLIDQIRSAAHAIMRIKDANRINTLRVKVASVIRNIGEQVPVTGDMIAVDADKALCDLNQLLTDIDESAREIDRAEEVDEEDEDGRLLDHDGEASVYAVGSLSTKEQALDPEETPARRPLEEVVRAPTSEDAPHMPQLEAKEEDEPPPRQRELA